MSDPLESLRNRIDELDRRLIAALAERQRVVTEIAGLKTDPVLPLQDAERERDLLSRVSALAGAQGLDSYFVSRFTVAFSSIQFGFKRPARIIRDAAQDSSSRIKESRVPIVTLLREVTSPRPRARFNSTATDHSRRRSRRWYVARRRWPSCRSRIPLPDRLRKRTIS